MMTIIRYLNYVQTNGPPKISFQKHIQIYYDEYFRSEYIHNNLIINPEYLKKKFSKISIVSDEKIIIAVDFYKMFTKKNNQASGYDSNSPYNI